MKARERTMIAACALIVMVVFGSAVVWAAERGFPQSSARNDIVPGRFFVDPPTLENLGFRWYVDGDANRNATVAVSYRVKGDEEWRKAQSMLRVRHEKVEGGYRTGNLFAGSVMFLQPGTEYEVMFTMTDPDGGAPAPKTITVATRSQAVAWKDGRKLDVKPGESIRAAYENAQPGDIILLQAGVHKPKDLPYVLKKSGEPGKPIVFRGVGADKTIIEGPNLNTDFFCLSGVHDIVIEDLTLRTGSAAIHTSPNHLNNMGNYFVIDPGFAGPGASDITIRRCRIENVRNGIWTCSENSRNWTITDNVIKGANYRWYPFEAHEDADSFIGICVYGQGHAVGYNRINLFMSLLCTADAGDPPAINELEKWPVNIDFYNNELFYGVGDTLRVDYTAHNVRVYRNMCSNARCGISVQPSFGGPIYIIRNEIYGITEHYFKWNNQPTGIIALHNTNGSSFYTTPHSNCHLRNNLFFGGTNSTTLTPKLHTMDYDGFGGNIFTWAHGDVPKISHVGIEKFRAATGFEKHGIMISRNDFVNAAQHKTGTSWTPDDFDLRLKEGSKAIDSGLRLNNINDDFVGAGPDRGALEFGAPLPHYGPREK